MRRRVEVALGGVGKGRGYYQYTLYTVLKQLINALFLKNK